MKVIGETESGTKIVEMSKDEAETLPNILEQVFEMRKLLREIKEIADLTKPWPPEHRLVERQPPPFARKLVD